MPRAGLQPLVWGRWRHRSPGRSWSRVIRTLFHRPPLNCCCPCRKPVPRLVTYPGVFPDALSTYSGHRLLSRMNRYEFITVPRCISLSGSDVRCPGSGPKANTRPRKATTWGRRSRLCLGEPYFFAKRRILGSLYNVPLSF